MNNSRWIRWIIPFMVTCCLGSCQQKGKLLKEGDWRGVFSLAENEIPFLFEVSGQAPESTTVYLLNGADKFPLKNITYRNDSVFIPIDLYDAVLKVRLNNHPMPILIIWLICLPR